MAGTKKSDSYSVSSAATKPGRTVSFTVPSLPRPGLPKKAPSGRVASGLAALAFIIAIVGAGFAGALIENHHDSGTGLTGSLSDQKRVVTSQSQLISQIAKTVGPSVVSVNVDLTSSTSQDSVSSLFGFSQPEAEQAAGTGIILSKDGVIMTNRHVVPAGTTSVSVTLSDGTELKDVSVIGRTSDTDSLDIAFLKIGDLKGHKLTPAAIGDSGKVQVGDNVVAIGNALGQFQNTVTSGIISGYGRSVQAGDGSDSSAASESLADLFQTDAAINEGNSGGPLVNLNGQVIGINTAIASDSQSIGFAIPINDVRGLVQEVLKTGKFSRPYLGVKYVPLTADVADEFGLSVTNGAFIAPGTDASGSSVIAGSPAADAGLQERDVITQVNGTNIDQNHSLTSLLDTHTPGDKVSLTVLRGKDTKHISVTLGTLPAGS